MTLINALTTYYTNYDDDDDDDDDDGDVIDGVQVHLRLFTDKLFWSNLQQRFVKTIFITKNQKIMNHIS